MSTDTFNTIIFTACVSGAIQLIVYLFKRPSEKRAAIELEALKTQQQIVLKAEMIAELLAEWTSFPEDPKYLNKLSYQAFLWLPDDIALDLSKLLIHDKEAKSVAFIIAEVRKHLLKSAIVTPDKIISFNKRNKTAIEYANSSRPQQG